MCSRSGLLFIICCQVSTQLKGAHHRAAGPRPERPSAVLDGQGAIVGASAVPGMASGAVHLVPVAWWGCGRWWATIRHMTCVAWLMDGDPAVSPQRAATREGRGGVGGALHSLPETGSCLKQVQQGIGARDHPPLRRFGRFGCRSLSLVGS